MSRKEASYVVFLYSHTRRVFYLEQTDVLCKECMGHTILMKISIKGEEDDF